MGNVLRIVLAAAVLTGGLLAVPGKASAYAPIYHDPNPYVEYIIQRESSGRPWVTNYLGCAGLMQRCPGSLLAADCPNWQDDVPCQMNHFTRYMQSRYLTWYNAYLFSAAHGWW